MFAEDRLKKLKRDDSDESLEMFAEKAKQTDAEIKELRVQIGERNFAHILKIFKFLCVNEEGPIQLQLYQFYTTEQGLIEKLPILLGGHRCDTFSKLLYVKMSGGSDHAKVHLPQFISAFEGLMDPQLKIRQKCIFNLLDVRKTGQLDIFFLLCLFKKLDRETMFA